MKTKLKAKIKIIKPKWQCLKRTKTTKNENKNIYITIKADLKYEYLQLCINNTNITM